MNPTLKNIIKTGLLFAAVGAMLALLAPAIGVGIGLEATYAEAAETLALTAKPLWMGAFFGTFGALNAAATPVFSRLFGDEAAQAPAAVVLIKEKTREVEKPDVLTAYNVEAVFGDLKKKWQEVPGAVELIEQKHSAIIQTMHSGKPLPSVSGLHEDVNLAMANFALGNPRDEVAQQILQVFRKQALPEEQPVVNAFAQQLAERAATANPPPVTATPGAQYLKKLLCKEPEQACLCPQR